jgi:NAD(P)-dependent dehydrogenase (short-subunit alcohol dehydrogenase family)
VPAVREAFGRVDAVVNNASLFEHDDLASFSVKAMEAHWRANTAPAILLARALHAALGEGRTGCVVNLTRSCGTPTPTT